MKREEESRDEEMQPKYTSVKGFKTIENKPLVEASPKPVETLDADDSHEIQKFSHTIEVQYHSVLSR